MSEINNPPSTTSQHGPTRDPSSSTTSQHGPTRAHKKTGRSKFYGDIEEMMYGFGDDWPPDTAAVNLVESLVTDYIEGLAERAVEVAELRGKLDKECFMFLVRKDRKKFNRVHKLIKTNEELKTVQKVDLKDDL